MSHRPNGSSSDGLGGVSSSAPLSVITMLSPAERQVLILGIALLLCGGCGGPVEPNLRAADLILVGLESGRLLLVDSKTPAVVGEIGPRAYPVHGSVVGRDGKRLFFSGKYPDNSWKLVAVDLNERQLFWALDQATPQGTIPSYSGVKLIPGSDALAVSSDGVVLYVNPAAQGTTTGIAVLDITTREVRGFWGPILSSGMTTLSGSAAADTLVVIGTRTADDDLIRDSVYVLRTGVSFEVLRVIPPRRVPPRSGASRGLLACPSMPPGITPSGCTIWPRMGTVPFGRARALEQPFPLTMARWWSSRIPVTRPRHRPVSYPFWGRAFNQEGLSI